MSINTNYINNVYVGGDPTANPPILPNSLVESSGNYYTVGSIIVGKPNTTNINTICGATNIIGKMNIGNNVNSNSSNACVISSLKRLSVNVSNTDTIINPDLYVDGTAIIESDASINGNLTSDNLTVNGSLTSLNDCYIGNSYFCGNNSGNNTNNIVGNTQMDSLTANSITVNGQTSINTLLSDILTINNSMYVAGTFSAVNGVLQAENIKSANSLSSNTANINSLTVRNSTINNLKVNSNTSLNNISVKANATVGGILSSNSVTIGNYILSVDPSTGNLIATYNNNGQTQVTTLAVPPTIYQIFAISSPSSINTNTSFDLQIGIGTAPWVLDTSINSGSVNISSDPSNGFNNPNQSDSTFSEGVATVSNLNFSSAGNYVLTVSGDQYSGIQPITINITAVIPISIPATIVFNPDPSTVYSSLLPGQSFSVTVQIEDMLGNIVSNYNNTQLTGGQISLIVSSGTGTLISQQVGFVNGVATFVNNSFDTDATGTIQLGITINQQMPILSSLNITTAISNPITIITSVQPSNLLSISNMTINAIKSNVATSNYKCGNLKFKNVVRKEKAPKLEEIKEENNNNDNDNNKLLEESNKVIETKQDNIIKSTSDNNVNNNTNTIKMTSLGSLTFGKNDDNNVDNITFEISPNPSNNIILTNVIYTVSITASYHNIPVSNKRIKIVDIINGVKSSNELSSLTDESGKVVFAGIMFPDDLAGSLINFQMSCLNVSTSYSISSALYNVSINDISTLTISNLTKEDNKIYINVDGLDSSKNRICGKRVTLQITDMNDNQIANIDSNNFMFPNIQINNGIYNVKVSTFTTTNQKVQNNYKINVTDDKVELI